MRALIRLVEDANASAILYHTTSAHAAHAILTSLAVRPKNSESFVSFSTTPLPGGDIEASDVTIAFRSAALHDQVEPVEYDEDWFDSHREQASYIAGEGWREQFEMPDDIYDEDGFADDDAEEEAFREGEYEAFWQKHSENEHISSLAGQPVRFKHGDVMGIILHGSSSRALVEWQEFLNNAGYSHVNARAN